MSQGSASSAVDAHRPALVLGVDGGGTKTIARIMAIGASGSLCVLGKGRAPGSNPMSVGTDAAHRAIHEAVRTAYRNCGEENLAVVGVLAIAGCGTPSVAQELHAWASKAGLAQKVLLVDDTRPLLSSVDPADGAIGLIAGTGSSAIAKPAKGDPLLVGGWGYLIDDAGSGFDLGRNGLRHAVRQLDQPGEDDALTRAALRYAGAAEPSQLKQSVYQNNDPRRWIAGFAAEVLRLAGEGDRSAASIVSNGAAELTALADAAWQRIGGSTDPRPVILISGGLLERSTLYRRLVIQRLVEQGWTRDTIRFSPDPATGCGILAAEHLRRGN